MNRVHTQDGLAIAVDDTGSRAGPAVIFVHGIAQDRTAFRSVLAGPLAARFRCVAFDVRGHGDSDKPEGAYATLGADLDAVLRGLGIERAVLAPWSYGAVVVGDYLRQYGAARVAGVLSIASAVAVGRSARAYFGPAMMDHVRGLVSADPAVYEASARAFVAGCATLPAAYGAERVAAMLRVPAHVRRALLGRDDDFVAELAAVRVAAVHGADDRVVLPALSERLTGAVTLLPGVQHVPFEEAPAQLEAAVSAFVESLESSRT